MTKAQITRVVASLFSRRACLHALTLTALLGFSQLSSADEVFRGNGIVPPDANAGTGALGGSSLSLTNNEHSLIGTWTLPANMSTHGIVVLYIETGDGGISNTSALVSNAFNDLTSAVTAVNKNDGHQKNDVSFPKGFMPNYAVAFNGFGDGGGFKLSQEVSYSGDISVKGEKQGTNYVLSIDFGKIGLPTSLTEKKTIKFVATYFETESGTRNGEAIGTFSSKKTSPSDGANSAAFSKFETYTIVPKP